MPDAHVKLVGVSKSFGGGTPAVDDVSLDVPRGSFTTLLGPSGCGKTTTLRMIAGFYDPDAGDIVIGQQRVNEVPAHRRKAAMVFQDYALFPHMTVEENVAYGLRLARMKRDDIRKRVGQTLDFLGLEGLGRRYPNQLSGGQQQRVALARALVMNPEVLLLDEPLSNLDAKLRVSIRAEMISIQRQLGITTIYVTHDQDEALAMSDWVAVMNRGKVVQWGKPWDAYYHPRTAFMADFLGSVNLIQTPIVSRSNGSVKVRIEGAEVDVPLLRGQKPGGEALLSVRPESLRLAQADERLGAGCVGIAGEVRRRTFLGHLMRYEVRVGQRDWLVDQPDPGGAALFEGPVQIVVNTARVHVITEADDLDEGEEENG